LYAFVFSSSVSGLPLFSSNDLKASDKFEKLDTFKRQDYMDKQSLVFPTQENKQEYLNKLSKDKTIIPLNGELFAGVPGLIGVELPKEYQKWIVSSANVGKGISFSIKPEAQNNNEAKGAVKWLNDWQNASSTVSSDSNLRDLLSKANGDILSLDLSQKEVEASNGKLAEGLLQPKKVIEYDASVKGSPDKTKLTEDQYKNLMMLKNLSVTANINNAKFLRMETPDKLRMETPDKQQDFMGQMKSQFGEPQKPSNTTMPEQATPNVKQSEFSNTDNPFYKAANQTSVSKPMSAGRGPKSSGPTFEEKQAQDIQNKINSLDDRIKTINSRRGSAQDKYRAYEMLKKERDQLQSELYKYTK